MASRLDGKRILGHQPGFSAASYPPVRNEKLRLETARYAGEKGNLQLPLDEPIPYALIARIVKARVRENREREEAKRKKKAGE